MTTDTTCAGARLRADLDAALAHASQEAGRTLEFDEAERESSTKRSPPLAAQKS